MKLSACIVIRNEEKLLPRCLTSIKQVVDEIILVHDGPCNDKSLAIGRQFGARIFVRSSIGEAEYHRPFCFEKAKGEWILQIDADEFLSEKAKKEIPQLIKSDGCDGYSFLWPYPDGKGGYIKKGPFAKTLKPCLFRREKMFMIGISHEYPRTYGSLCKRPDVILEHQPEYDNFTFEVFRKKWTTWAELQAKQIKNINKAPTFNIADSVKKKVFFHYLYMRKHPVLSGLAETFKFLTIYLLRGILLSGGQSLKIAIFELLYLWLVKINLLKLER